MKKIKFKSGNFYYHGSCYRFQKFDPSFLGKGTDQMGSGFYLTTSKSTAMGYMADFDQKKRAFGDIEINPCFYKVKVNATRFFSTDYVHPITRALIKDLILASPDLEDALTNYGDVSYEGFNKVLARALESYDGFMDMPLIMLINTLSNDFYKGHEHQFNMIIAEKLGFEGVYCQLETETHICVWDPEKLEIQAILTRDQIERLESQSDTPEP